MSTRLAAAERQTMTYAEFLAFDEASETRHEFVAGELVAMSGGTRRIDIVTGNLFATTRAALPKHGPCRLHLSNLGVRLDDADCLFYPDLHITCDPRDHADPRLSRHPTVIFEVLSESTADYDFGRKFSKYKQIGCLQEYVLLDTVWQSITLFCRASPRQWLSFDLDAADTLELASVGVRIPVADLYVDSDVPLHLPRPRLVEPG